MDARVFDRFRSLVYEKAGIALSDGKETLVSARLGKRMRALGLQDYQAYFDYAREHEAEGELTQLLNAICTNFTSFYRESDHFELLQKVIEKWASEGQRRFRIWSAASSTGEEPYTIAMVLREVAGDRDIDIKILATDLSTRVLEKACAGVYSEEQIKPVPAVLRERYFHQTRGEDGICYQVKDELKDMVVYRRLNLSTPPFPMCGPLDVVFCRNVMIYFDRSVRARLVNEIHRLLGPGGYLLVGHAESLAGLGTPFRCVRPSVYVKEQEGPGSRDHCLGDVRRETERRGIGEAETGNRQLRIDN